MSIFLKSITTFILVISRSILLTKNKIFYRKGHKTLNVKNIENKIAITYNLTAMPCILNAHRL